MHSDPWHGLAPSAGADWLTAKRVDPSLPFDFFWARASDKRCLLVLRHAAESSPTGRLPNLRGVEITIATDPDGSRNLILRLLDSAQREIFYRLCIDIVLSTKGTTSEREAVAAAVSRTWRWHHLLRGGSESRLSAEEQKGLLAELAVLRKLFEHLAHLDAVSAWRGPLDAPKDFEVGQCAVEVKGRRGAATPYVVISSEHQLDTSGVQRLLLSVHDFSQMPASEAVGSTLTQSVLELRELLSAHDPEAAALFESLVTSAGFRWEDDYTDSKWAAGRESLYDVRPGFPRITPSCFGSGVRNVRYSVSLPDCEPFLVPDTALASLFTRGD